MNPPTASVRAPETDYRTTTEERGSTSVPATLTRRYHKSEIAALSMHEISNLSREELIGIIESVPRAFIRTPDAERFSERLDFLSRKTLERLTFIVRRCCRNQGY